jgi:hypothetical protein
VDEAVGIKAAVRVDAHYLARSVHAKSQCSCTSREVNSAEAPSALEVPMQGATSIYVLTNYLARSVDAVGLIPRPTREIDSAENARTITKPMTVKNCRPYNHPLSGQHR